MVIGGTLAAVSEAFALARKAGVDPAQACGRFCSAGSRAAGCSKRTANASCKRTTCPASARQLFAKDLGIASDTLAEFQSPAPVAAVVQQLVSALMASGQADADYSALATVLFELAGLDRV